MMSKVFWIGRSWTVVSKVCIIIVVLLITTEIILRFVFGFCDALLYQSSDKYEYIAQPNQTHYRFFSHIRINSYGLRCEEPDSTKNIVLGLGDSVLFGPAQNDQDSLATTLFTNETGIQMLNISCGSWGPDNCVAYLKEHGTFGAGQMVLVCSSHDAYDRMTFIPIIGLPGYSDEQYKFAIWELLDRYVVPKIDKLFKQPVYLDPDAEVVARKKMASVIKKSNVFNEGFNQLKALSDSLQLPLTIYLHAETGEISEGEYNDLGKEIIAWADSCHIPLINGMKEGETPDMYIDIIHLNEKGHRHLADILKNKIFHESVSLHSVHR